MGEAGGPDAGGEPAGEKPKEVTVSAHDRRLAKLVRQCRISLVKPPENRSKSDLEPLLKFTATLPEFKKLPMMRREEVVRAIEPEDFEDRNVIFWQGDEGDKYYVILTGEIEIWGLRKVVKKETKPDAEQMRQNAAARRKMSSMGGMQRRMTRRNSLTRHGDAHGEEGDGEARGRRGTRRSIMGGLGGISEDGEGGEGGEGGGSRSPARRQSNLGSLGEEGKKVGGTGAEGAAPSSPSGTLKKSAAGKWAGVKAVVKLMGISNKSKLKEEEPEEPEEELDVDEGLFTPTDDHTLYVTLKAQGAFGELALITNKPRAATAVAKGPTTLLAIQREEYQRIMVGGMAKAIQEKVNFLKASPVFKSLEDSTHHLTSLSYSFHLDTLERGAVLYREGDEPECVYIIKEGFCKVHRAKAKGGAGLGRTATDACALAILGPLSILGEQEVILGCKRKATVVADTKTSVYKMNAPDFRIMPAFILQGLRKEAQMRETFESERLKSIAGTMEQHRQSTKRFAQAHSTPKPPLSEAQLRAEQRRSAVHTHSLEHFKPLKSLNEAGALAAARRPKVGATKKAAPGPGAVTKAFLRAQPQMAGGSIERLARPRTPVGEGGIATGIRSDELAVKVGRPDGIERAKRMAEMCRRLKHTRKPHESDMAKLRWNKESDRVSVGAHLQGLTHSKGSGGAGGV